MTTPLKGAVHRLATVEIDGEEKQFVISITPLGISVKETRKHSSMAYLYPLQTLVKDAMFAREGMQAVKRAENRKKYAKQRKTSPEKAAE